MHRTAWMLSLQMNGRDETCLVRADQDLISIQQILTRKARISAPFLYAIRYIDHIGKYPVRRLILVRRSPG